MNDITLFDYQQEMVTRVHEAFRKHQSVMVQMPTGTGKTIVLANVVFSFLEKDKRDVWVVAHRRELVSQIRETFSKVCENSVLSALSRIRVMSIQWLTLHYREMEEEPSLIVIDEAHHAVAKTYAEVMKAFPKAKKLGLTATPYRLNGNGFTDLFDVLLTSWSMERFLAEGRLSLYDYYSIKPDSADQQLIDSLKKRGADGDYQQKELNEVMDVRPSLERLCMTVKRYVPRKKGIVYAFSIEHAEHIAESYCENGINAVAISSKTPSNERKSLVEQFKKGKIQVLVSVDLFSEGFDCPDVQFIQLARPTLSLSKYLQMVGRGLRVAKDKEYCVILDNVGLYHRFGLPSADRDWQSMFLGQTATEHTLQEACMRINSNSCRMADLTVDGGEMTRIIGHDRQQQTISRSYGFTIASDERGKKGIADKDGNTIVACQYTDIELTGDGFAHCRKGKTDRGGKWIDLRNGLLFDKRPQSITLLGINFSTEDDKRFYPRIRSKFIDDKAYLTIKTLELQVGSGLSWKQRFIPWNRPDKVYIYKGGVNDLRLYCDEEDHYVVQENIGSELVAIESQEQMDKMCRECKERYEQELKTRKELEKAAEEYRFTMTSKEQQKGWVKEGHGLVYCKSNHGETEAWIDLMAMKIYTERPTQLFQRGFVEILRMGEWCYVRNIPDLRNKPFRDWEIVADDNICVINNEFLFLKQEPRLWYRVFKRTDDFSYFVVKKHEANYKNYIGIPDITITQFGNDGLKMEMRGVPYTPYFQPELKKQWMKPKRQSL